MASAQTYVPIQTTTLGTSAASITLSSIPTTYTDLVLVINPSSTSAGVNNEVQVGNGTVDTGSNYSTTQIYGDGTTPYSTRLANSSFTYSGMAEPNATSVIQFMNYANTLTYKTFLSRGSGPSSYVTAEASLWRNTAAINIIKLTGQSGSYGAGTTFTLYGIAAA